MHSISRALSARRALLSSAFALGAGIGGAGPVFAQEQTGQSVGLDEIIVTAQRREENLQRAAVAVDVVSAEQLSNSGVTNSSDLNALVPALSINQGGGPLTSYFVRGVGNFTQNGFSDGAIAFNLDGVYVGRPTSTVGTFYDLARIEVLKGPQGTLYGRNATAGAINVIPNRPEIGAYGGDLSASYGNFNAFNVQGAVNLPVGDQAALRLSANFIDRDGYNDDGTSDEEGEAFRAQLLIEPNDDVSIRIAADFAHQGGVGPGAALNGRFVSTPGTPATATSPAGQTFQPSGLPIDGGLLSPASQAVFRNYIIAGVNPAPLAMPFLDNEYKGVLAELNFSTAIGQLTVIPAYREASLNFLFNGPAFRAGQTVQHDEQSSLEVRLDGNRIGIFDWLIGGFYFDETVDGDNALNQYSPIAFQDYTSTTESIAYFGRLTANLTEDFRVVAGVRATKDDKTMQATGFNVIQICTAGPPLFCTVNGSSLPLGLTPASLGITLPTLPGAPNSVQFGGNPSSRIFTAPLTISSAPTFERTTYRIAGEWDVGENSLLYASYETGFRSGGFSISFGREFFRPEIIEAVTLGAKNRFFDNRLQLNAEIFHWAYTNQQVSHFGADLRGNNSFFTENIGESTIQGVDVEGQWLPVDSTLLTFSAQYLDSVVDRFSFRQLRTPGVAAVTGCLATPVQDRDIQAGSTDPATFDPEFVINCAGKRGYNSPEWSLDFGIEHTVPVGALDVKLSADTRYRGDRVVGFDYLPQQSTGEDWTTNAAISLAPREGRWVIGAYVRNIEDNRVPTIAQFASTTGGSMTTVYSPPLTYGVRAGVSF